LEFLAFSGDAAWPGADEEWGLQVTNDVWEKPPQGNENLLLLFISVIYHYLHLPIVAIFNAMLLEATF
jgi:hypothetical protein